MNLTWFNTTGFGTSSWYVFSCERKVRDRTVLNSIDFAATGTSLHQFRPPRQVISPPRPTTAAIASLQSTLRPSPPANAHLQQYYQLPIATFAQQLHDAVSDNNRLRPDNVQLRNANAELRQTNEELKQANTDLRNGILDDFTKAKMAQIEPDSPKETELKVEIEALKRKHA